MRVRLISAPLESTPRQRLDETYVSSWQVIEAGVKVGENKAPAVFADIQKGGANLKKTETNDKSAPVIDSAAKISEAPQSALFAEIAAKGQTA